jgi:hypothetical protein
MIQMQIIEQPGAGLHAELVAAMRSGSLQTFSSRNGENA